MNYSSPDPPGSGSQISIASYVIGPTLSAIYALMILGIASDAFVDVKLGVRPLDAKIT